MPLEQTAGEKPPIDEKSPIYTPPEKAKSRSFCAELSSSITVEPAAFLYFIGLITASTTTEQYAFYRLSNKHNELENHELQNHQLLKKCMPSYNKTASIVADEVATETAQFLVFFNLVNQVPPVFVALLMGSYTDRMGRKVALVAPVIGGGLRAILTLIIIYLDLSMKYLYLAAAVEGLSGGSATFTMALFAYVADISTKERRSIRIFMVQLVNTLGMAMAQITIGYMIFYWSFSYPYGLILCIYVMCLGLICMLRESVADTRPTPLLTCQHIERTVRLFVPPVGDPAVCTLRLCLLLILLDSMVEAGGLNALLLFLLSWPACFSSILLGFYLALLWSLTSLGSLMVLKALFFRMGDTGLILLGCAAGILMRLWLTLPIYDTTYIFLSAVIGFLSALVSPLTRAVMSKNVSPKEQGAVSGAVSLTSQLSGFIGSLMINWIYAATDYLYSGIVFGVCAGLYAMAFICAICIRVRLNGQKTIPLCNQPQQKPKQESDKDMTSPK